MTNSNISKLTLASFLFCILNGMTFDSPFSGTCDVETLACPTSSASSFEEGLCYSECANGYSADIGDDECTEDGWCWRCDSYDRTITTPDYSSMLSTALGVTDGFTAFFDDNTYGELVNGFYDCFKDEVIAKIDWTNIDGPISLTTEMASAASSISFTNLKTCVTNLKYLLNEDDSIVIAIEIAPSYSVGTGFGSTYGIAFDITFDSNGDVDNIGLYLYDGGCALISSTLSIGIDIAFVAYRSLSDISGTALVYGVGADVPLTDLGASLAIAVNDNCETIGIAFSLGFGVGTDLLPFEISGGYCFASDLNHFGDY